MSSLSISAGPSIPNEFITDHTIDGEQNISKLLNVVDNDAAHWLHTYDIQTAKLPIDTCVDLDRINRNPSGRFNL